MSWQEDLQQLDAALAGGQISADEYRRHRDEVLAKASGSSVPAEASPASPAQPPGQSPTPQSQYGEPGQQAPGQQGQQGAEQAPEHQGQNYFPPPFRWQSTAPSASAEATQTIRPVSPNSDSTQVVSAEESAADRTQVVRGGP